MKNNFKLSTFDILLEIVSLLLIIAIWLYVCLNYASLPSEIPMHFSISWKVDSLSDKSSIFILLWIITFLYVLFSVLNFIPFKKKYLKYNYTNISEQRGREIYELTVKKLRIEKIFVIWILAIITYSVMNSQDLHWLIILSLPLILIFIEAFYLIKTFSSDTEKK